MKKEKIFLGVMSFALVIALYCVPAAAQKFTGGLKGKVTQNSEPMANLQLVFTDTDMGRQYKAKTDKNGEFYSDGMRLANYKLQIIGPNKEVLYTNDHVAVGSNSLADFPIELAKPEASGGVAGGASSSGGGNKKMSKEEIAKANADNAKIGNLNELIKQAQAAMQQQNWADADKALTQLIAADPTTTRWEFYKALADSQRNEGKAEESLQTYDKGVQVAQSVASGTAAKDPRNPNPDPTKAKAGAGTMLTSEGNVYVQLGKIDQALEAFRKAAEIDPNPATPYYNLCALAFNAAKYDAAVSACDKSTAADPNKADAWFFKGVAQNKLNNPAANESLNKYLQLDPNGIHAAQAKQLLGQK
ncbi:MAG TPA: tetratricopeptide repeat protein [Candidatus Angelobacter sp.]|nr:tetratricopeptide repeat protein [Candidatus Angelobacter sp.]